jgi:hypothetical protein
MSLAMLIIISVINLKEVQNYLVFCQIQLQKLKGKDTVVSLSILFIYKKLGAFSY